MAYTLFLEAPGDYALANVTQSWSRAANSDPTHPVAYWTGAMVPEQKQQAPGSPFWRDRFGSRTLAAYFRDYGDAALRNGATGTYLHSICRMAKLPAPANRPKSSPPFGRRERDSSPPANVQVTPPPIAS